MADTVVIDIIAQVSDQTAAGAKSAEANVSRLEKSMQGVQATAKKKSKLEIAATLADKASKGIASIGEKAKSVAGKAWAIGFGIADKASKGIRAIAGAAKSLANKAWQVTVGIVDKVTAPIRGMISKIGELIGIAGAASTVLGGLTVKSALGASAAQSRAETQLGTVLRNVTPSSAPEFGDRGGDVRKLQEFLNEAYDANLALDGIYGKLTRRAAQGYAEKTGEDFSSLFPGIWKDNFEQLQKAADRMQKETMFSSTAMTAGAAEFATYISDAAAIEQMMGTLADYAAGMSGGVELSEAQMTEYATQLGKALNAEDAAFDGLKKKGFALSEAQEKILKSSLTSDLEKTAALSEIIAESWGGLAKEFAETPTGQITKVKNEWGSLQAMLGKKLEPSVGRLFAMLSSKMPLIEKLLLRGADGLGGWIDKIIPAIGRGIDWAADGIDRLSKKLSGIAGNAEFKEAGIFGKAKILGGELIAAPFEEWWSNSGKAWAAEKGRAAAEWLMAGIKSGLGGAFGIDVDISVDNIISGIGEIREKISGIIDSEEFADAKLFGKAKILWGELIAEPFVEWWDGSGRALFEQKAGELGGIIGSGLKNAILFALGIELDAKGGAIGEGAGIAKAFGQAFSEGFDADEVMGAIWAKIKAFMAANPLATTMFITAKTLPLAANTAKTASWLGKLFSLGGAGAGGASAAGGAGLAGAIGPLAAAAGIVASVANIASALGDVQKAGKAVHEKDQTANYASAAAKGGSLFAGAIIGSIILPGLGTAIGAAAGGLIGLIFGESAGKYISDLLDGTHRIKDITKNLEEATSSFQASLEKDLGVQRLLDDLEEIQAALSSGGLDSAGLAAARSEMQGIVADLVGIYPDLITAYDKENGLIQTKIDRLRALSQMEFESSKRELKQNISDAQVELVGAGQKIADSEAAEAKYRADAQVYASHEDYFRGLLTEGEVLERALSSITGNSEEALALFREAEASLNKYLQDTADELLSIGLESAAFSVINDELGGLAYELQKYKDLADSNEAAATIEAEKQANLWALLETAYESQKALIEGELGQSLDDMAAGYHTMGEEGRQAFDKATAKLSAFTRQFEIESRKWKADIEINWPARMNEGRTEAFAVPKELQIHLPGSANASGDIVTRPEYGLIGEAGPEAIIPLSRARRGRGLALWERAGEMMGIEPYAGGGIVGKEPNTGAEPSSGEETGAWGAGEYITVNIDGISFEVRIDGGGADEAAILSAIKSNIKGLADEIARQIAQALRQSFANMPKAAGGSA